MITEVPIWSSRPLRSLSAGASPRAAHDALAVWRRLPFTTTVVFIMLVAGLATGALWHAAEDAPWYPYVAFGLPSFAAGRWWTVVTGAFFAVQPWYYLPMTGSFALLVGWAEWRMGTRLTVAVAVGGHLFGVLGASVALLVLRDPNWAWSTQTANLLDVGFSAGALGTAAVASALLRPPWRLRVRARPGDLRGRRGALHGLRRRSRTHARDRRRAWCSGPGSPARCIRWR